MNRSGWVDQAKGVGIALVVYGHCTRGLVSAGLARNDGVLAAFDNVIYTFHMPLFFVLAGVFFEPSLRRRGALGLLASKVGTLVYPYVLWSLLQGSFEVLMARLTNGHRSFSSLVAIGWQPIAQFWFLYVLFLCFVVFVLLHRALKGPGLLACAVALVLLFLVRRRFFAAGSLADLLAANAVFFFAGVVFAHGASSGAQGWCQRLERHFWILLASFSAAQFILATVLKQRYDTPGVAALCVSVVSLAAVLSLAMRLERWGADRIRMLGANSMPIYLMHITAASGTRIVLVKLGVTSLPVHVMLGVAAGLLLPVLAVRLMRRYGLDFLMTLPASASQWNEGRRRHPTQATTLH